MMQVLNPDTKKTKKKVGRFCNVSDIFSIVPETKLNNKNRN